MAKIATKYTPSAPFIGMEWSAGYDDHEPGHPIGYGKTEADAIADLEEQAED